MNITKQIDDNRRLYVKAKKWYVKAKKWKKLGKIDWGVTPYQDIPTASIMRCSQIKPGMIFDSPADGVVWMVIREGNYYIEGGKRKRIDNIFKNKWWCQIDDGSLPEMLCCFDLIFDNAETNKFRWPKK